MYSKTDRAMDDLLPPFFLWFSCSGRSHRIGFVHSTTRWHCIIPNEISVPHIPRTSRLHCEYDPCSVMRVKLSHGTPYNLRVLRRVQTPIPPYSTCLVILLCTYVILGITATYTNTGPALGGVIQVYTAFGWSHFRPLCPP
ncbi:hypothetical protein BX600DRAFT_254752 [Xylariales sp. PMI_506]|nr:hypothetical protein BX600DRAFT_254752 [Xylariales sp. PMI_506]